MPSSPSDFDFEPDKPMDEFDIQSPEPTEFRARSQRLPCPMCGELIAGNARLCRYCGERLVDDPHRPLGRYGDVDPEMIKKFRREVHGVGGFWIFISVLHVVISLALSTLLQGRMNREFQNIMVMVLIAFAAIYVLIGVFTFLKHRWALYVGLVFGYLGIVSAVYQLAGRNICGGVFGIAIYAAVVVQTHRTLGWARKMIDNDIPLTAKPEEFQ